MRIRDREIGPGHPVYVIAEIGINHNGKPRLAKEMITAAHAAGADAVKFQKRTVDVVYTAEELAKPRKSVFGETNGDLKRGLELDEAAYAEIDKHCRTLGITWFASPWDEASVDFLERFDVPAYKVASACVTDLGLLARIKATGKPALISDGMSTRDETRVALNILYGGRGKWSDEEVYTMHCTSVYPCPPELCNLDAASEWGWNWGYSGHELGWVPTIGAVAQGARVIERHFTLSRNLWGSDQSASLEPDEFRRMVQDIRVMELALGDGVKRVYDEELPAREKLRRFK